MLTKRRKRRVRWVLGALLALGGLGVLAAPGGLYMGLGAGVDGQEFTYGKTVYTEEGLARGEVTSAEGDADQTLTTLGVFGGYRWDLPISGLHLSAEVDVA